MGVTSNLRFIASHNVRALRTNPWSEISGSLGDLGTLLPLLIALAIQGSISLSTTLVFSGLANVLTGACFGVPLPVQPMKAIAAVAIARSMTLEQTISAGLFVSGVVFLLSVTGLLRWFGRVIPIPVVKGIQVGAGLSLILSAGSSLLQKLDWTRPSWADNLLWAIVAFLLLLGSVHAVRLPYALCVFVFGVVFACAQIAQASEEARAHFPNFQLWHPSTYVPSGKDFKEGALSAGVGQVPLTVLNSIIAVSHLSADLLPNVPTPSTTSIGLSVAMMNLLGCWFGAMPVCHGSGGLAGQFKFGARSGSSIIILGVFKILLGLLFGESLVGVLKYFPKALLGIMVIAAGLELAKVGENLNSEARDLMDKPEDNTDHVYRKPDAEECRQRWMTMLTTIAGLLAFRNDAVGFIAGLACHWSYQMPSVVTRWTRRHTRRSSEREPLLA